MKLVNVAADYMQLFVMMSNVPVKINVDVYCK